MKQVLCKKRGGVIERNIVWFFDLLGSVSVIAGVLRSGKYKAFNYLTRVLIIAITAKICL